MYQIKRRKIEEKLFHHYLDFPLEIRKVVIDEMETMDRCRFTRCSKQSNTDAKSSENFLYQISFIMHSSQVRMVVIFFEEYEGGDFWGYELVFKEINGKLMRKYKCHDHQKSWENELDGSKNYIEHGVEEFKKLLRTHQNAVRLLEIDDNTRVQNNLRNLDFEITNMRNLRKFFINGNVNVQQYLSKLKQPLEVLNIEKSDEDFYDQIYQVTHSLTLDHLNLTKEQFWQLKAKDVHIPIGQLSEMDILQFIQSWQDGSIGREIERFKWNLHDSVFDVEKLLGYLKSPHNDPKIGIQIKHSKNPRLFARLTWKYGNLKFKVKPHVSEQ